MGRKSGDAHAGHRKAPAQESPKANRRSFDAMASSRLTRTRTVVNGKRAKKEYGEDDDPFHLASGRAPAALRTSEPS